MCSESAYSCLLFLELLGLTNGGVVIQMYIEKNIAQFKSAQRHFSAGEVGHKEHKTFTGGCLYNTRHRKVIVPNTHFSGSDTYTVSIHI